MESILITRPAVFTETQNCKQKLEIENPFSLPAFSSIVKLIMAHNNTTDKERQFWWLCLHWSKEPILALILLPAPSCHITESAIWLHRTRGREKRQGLENQHPPCSLELQQPVPAPAATHERQQKCRGSTVLVTHCFSKQNSSKWVCKKKQFRRKKCKLS